MKKKDKNVTDKTEIVGGSDYKGYNSVDLGAYDKISDEIEDKAESLGGVFDNDAKSYDGNRYKFKNKEDRRRFNDYVKRKKKGKKKKKDDDKDDKKDDAPKAKTQKELDKLKESRIRRIINEEICRLTESLKSDLLRNVAAKHGGIENSYGGHAWTRGGWKNVPIDQITDDMFDTDEVTTDRNQLRHGIMFKDRTVLPFADPQSRGGQKVLDIADKLEPKLQQRSRNKSMDGKDGYIPATRGAEYARDVKSSMQIGRNSMKHGEEEKAKHPEYYWQQHWDDYIRDAKTMHTNALKAYNKWKNNGLFKDKTPRY